MKPVTFLQSKKVIKSPIPFISYSKLTKKPTQAFFLNLSSDFNLTSSAKSKDNANVIDSYTKRNSTTQFYSRELKTSSSTISRNKLSITQNSRFDTKECTSNKQFNQIEEENLSDSSLTEKSISFSAFIIPSHESEPVKTFSTLCKNINIFDNKKKTTKKPRVKRKIKTTEEIEFERIIQERDECKQLRITNTIKSDTLKNYETAHLHLTSRSKIIPKPFKLNVNSLQRKKKNELNCSACNAPLTKKKNITEMCNQIPKSIKTNVTKVKSNKVSVKNTSKQVQRIDTKEFLTHR